MSCFVLIDTDNTTSVCCVNGLYSPWPQLADLCRELQSIAKPRKLQLAARHIPGKLNCDPDALSRAATASFASAVLSQPAVDFCARYVPRISAGGSSTEFASPLPLSTSTTTVCLTDISTRPYTRLHDKGTVLWCPPPHLRFQVISAVAGAPKGSGPHAILLPSLPAKHCWLKRLQTFKQAAHLQSPVFPLFQPQPSISLPCGAQPIDFPHASSGPWTLWLKH